jgi:hypothetical protein
MRNKIAQLRYVGILDDGRNPVADNCQRWQDINAGGRKIGREVARKIATHAIGRVFCNTMIVTRGTNRLRDENNQGEAHHNPAKAGCGSHTSAEIFSSWQHCDCIQFASIIYYTCNKNPFAPISWRLVKS